MTTPGDGSVPSILTGVDGEPPTYVAVAVAGTEEEALTFAVESGELVDRAEATGVRRVLMRELDPVACRIRGVDDGWWVECTKHARRPVEFWRIDE